MIKEHSTVESQLLLLAVVQEGEVAAWCPLFVLPGIDTFPDYLTPRIVTYT